MHRYLCAVLLAFAVTLSGLPLAAAQNVERSGNTYHKRVCPGPSGPGTARCHAHIVTDNRGNPLFRDLSPSALSSGFGGESGTGLRAVYNIPWTGSTTDTPNGPFVAIVDAYGYKNAEADLAIYRSTYGLPPCTTKNGCFKKVGQTGGAVPTKSNLGWNQEQALDLDMVSAICPNCRILLVEAKSANYNDLAAAVNYAKGSTYNPIAISNSYGGNEGAESASNRDAYNTHTATTVITVSTGDSGYGAGPQYPATLTNVIAVGGTHLTKDNSTRGWSESVWSGAGSGCSKLYPAPSWQNTAANPCGFYAGTTKFRADADVSAVADPGTGVAVYGPVLSTFSSWLVIGGTSASAPIIAGIYGAQGGTPPGGDWLYSHAGYLNDVTSGNNGSCGGSTICNAGAGYDGPTGLGTPNGGTAF